MEPNKYKSKRMLLGIIGSVLIFCSILSVFQGCKNALSLNKNGSVDFGGVWLSAKLILSGKDPYTAWLTKTSGKLLADLPRSERIFFSPAYLPSALIVIFPYALLPFKTAAAAYLATNLILTGVFLTVTYLFTHSKSCPPRHYLILILLFLCGTPFRNTLGMGQSPIIALSFFLLALFFDEKRRWVLSGAFLAFSLLKYHLTLPFILFIFVFERRWRPLFVCGLIHLVSHAWLCHLMQTSPLGVFLVSWKISIRAIHYAASKVDIFLIFRTLLKTHAPGTFSSPIYYLLPSVIIAALLVFIAVIWQKKGKDLGIIGKLSLASIFALFYAYHNIYDFVCLFFPLLWICVLKEHRAWRITAGIGIGYLFFVNRLFLELGRQGYSPFSEASGILSILAFYAVLIPVLSLSHLISSQKK